jgi:hypothetical protein
LTPTVIFFLNGSTFLKEDVTRSVIAEGLEAGEVSGEGGFFPRISSKSLSVEEIMSGLAKAELHF